MLTVKSKYWDNIAKLSITPLILTCLKRLEIFVKIDFGQRAGFLKGKKYSTLQWILLSKTGYF